MSSRRRRSILFAIIFVWTPPHFWALALVRTTDYGRAGVPMMPNVKGADRTRLEILIYSVVLALLGVLPYRTWLRVVSSTAASAPFSARSSLACALHVYRVRERRGGQQDAPCASSASRSFISSSFRRTPERALDRARHRFVRSDAWIVRARSEGCRPHAGAARRAGGSAISPSGSSSASSFCSFYAVTIVKLGPGVLKPPM